MKETDPPDPPPPPPLGVSPGDAISGLACPFSSQFPLMQAGQHFVLIIDKVLEPACVWRPGWEDCVSF